MTPSEAAHLYGLHREELIAAMLARAANPKMPRYLAIEAAIIVLHEADEPRLRDRAARIVDVMNEERARLYREIADR